MVGKRCTWRYALICILFWGVQGFAKGPSIHCKVLLLEENKISVEIPIPEEIRNPSPREIAQLLWAKRAFLIADAFRSSEKLTFQEKQFRGGYARNSLEFRTLIEKTTRTYPGRYLLQFAIRLSKVTARGLSHNAAEVETLAGDIFLTLLNGRHSVIDGKKTGKEKPLFKDEKFNLLQETLYSLLPSLQQLEQISDSLDSDEDVSKVVLLQLMDGLGWL